MNETEKHVAFEALDSYGNVIHAKSAKAKTDYLCMGEGCKCIMTLTHSKLNLAYFRRKDETQVHTGKECINLNGRSRPSAKVTDFFALAEKLSHVPVPRGSSGGTTGGGGTAPPKITTSEEPIETPIASLRDLHRFINKNYGASYETASGRISDLVWRWDWLTLSMITNFSKGGTMYIYGRYAESLDVDNQILLVCYPKDSKESFRICLLVTYDEDYNKIKSKARSIHQQTHLVYRKSEHKRVDFLVVSTNWRFHSSDSCSICKNKKYCATCKGCFTAPVHSSKQVLVIAAPLPEKKKDT